MADPFAVPDDLDAIFDDIWTRWTRGQADRRSPFHTPIIASVADTRSPVQRVMVLRRADRATGALRFHTDLRSNKVGQFGQHASLGIVGYDASAKIQLRAGGTAEVLHTGAAADAAWAGTSPSGRRSYLTTLAPGAVSTVPTTGLPRHYEDTVPTVSQSEAGRVNFAIVIATLDHLEWLHLASTGHRRAAFTRTGDDWRGEWLIP